MKLKFKAACRKLIADVDMNVDLKPHAYRPAANGAESSRGLVPVIYGEEDMLSLKQNNGAFYKVCLETRKPPEKMVDGLTTKRLRKLEEDKMPISDEVANRVRDGVKAELWEITAPKRKYIFVWVNRHEVIALCNYPDYEKVASLLRSIFGTWPTEPQWDGDAFSDLVVEHLVKGYDIGMSEMKNSIDLTRVADNSSVAISDDPNLEGGVITEVLRGGAVVRSVGFRAEGEPVDVLVDATACMTGDILDAGCASLEDDDLSDAIITLGVVRGVASVMVDLTGPFETHDEVTEDE